MLRSPTAPRATTQKAEGCMRETQSGSNDLRLARQDRENLSIQTNDKLPLQARNLRLF